MKTPVIAIIISLFLLSTGVLAADQTTTMNANTPAPAVKVPPPAHNDPTKIDLVIKNAEPLFHNTANPVAGNPNGKITLVEFFDYQCSHCAAQDPIIVAMVKGNPDIKIIYKEFPILSTTSTFASKAALAANKQGKYFPFHEALIQSSSSLTEDKILTLAKSVGLDIDKLKADMKSDEIADAIKANYSLAKTMGINGTPTLIGAPTDIPQNKQGVFFILGATDLNYLQSLIRQMNT